MQLKIRSPFRLFSLRIPIFLLISLIFSACFFETDKNLWEELTLIENAEADAFRVQSLHRTQAGVLIAVGYYKDDQVACGALNAWGCSFYKIYRSRDEGRNWEDVSDAKIAEKHAFTKGDNIPSALLPVGAAVKAAKTVIDPVIYSDQWHVSYLSSDDNKIFLYIDNSIYISEDEGKTWTDHTDPGSGSSALGSQEDPYGLFDSHLVFRDRMNNSTSVYARNKDQRYKRLDLNKNEQWKNFTIFHTASGQTKLIPPGKELSGNYYLEFDRFTRKKNDGDIHRIHEVFETAGGAYFASIVQLGGADKRSAYWYLWRSVDQGATFSKVKLYGGEEEQMYDMVRIYGCIGNKLVLSVWDKRNAEVRAGESNMRINRFYLFDTQSGLLSKFVFPPSVSFSMDESFKFAFDVDKNVIYLGMMKGIFKSKAGYQEKVFQEADYQRSQTAPDEYLPKEVVAFDLFDIMEKGINCRDRACLEKIFPAIHFSYAPEPSENGTDLAIGLQPKPGVWISKANGEFMDLKFKVINGHTDLDLLIEAFNGGDALLELLDKAGYTSQELRFVNQRERFIMTKKGRKNALMVEKNMEDEDHPIYRITMSSGNAFIDKNEHFAQLVAAGKKAPSKGVKTEMGFKLGMSRQEYIDNLQELLEKEEVFQSDQAYFFERKFSGADFRWFAKGLHAMVVLNPMFDNDGRLFRLGLVCYGAGEGSKQKGFSEALYREIRKEFDKSRSSDGYETFLLDKVSHYIKDNAYIRISNGELPIIEFMDLSNIQFDIDYNEAVEIKEKNK